MIRSRASFVAAIPTRLIAQPGAHGATRQRKPSRKQPVRRERLLDPRQPAFGRNGRRRQRGHFRIARVQEPVVQVFGGESLREHLELRVRPAVQAEPDRRQAVAGLRAVVPAGQLPTHDQHVRRRRDEAFQAQPDAGLPHALDVQRGLLDDQPLRDLQAPLVGRQVKGQFADRLGAGVGALLVAGRRPWHNSFMRCGLLVPRVASTVPPP